MSNTEKKTVRFYNAEEIKVITNIAAMPKDEQPAAIKDLAKLAGRSYASVWAKMWSLRNPENVTAIRKRSYNKKKKVEVPATTAKKTTVRKFHTPADNGTTMQVSQKELRFPIKGIRFENGEVVVTL